MIKEIAYAKINLMLKVNKTLENGMHEIETIMAPLKDLFDELAFSKRDDNKIVVEGIDFENNSVLKAAELFQETYKTPGVNITVKKNIPVASGLGGGSADSSATLRGLNRLFKLKLSLEDLSVLADKLGSDNAYCLYNQLAYCNGRGNNVKFINKKLELPLVLIFPSFGLSTKLVFEKWNNETTEFDYDLFISSLNKKGIDELMFNDLFEPACKCDAGRLNEVKEKVEAMGYRCHMSGSGSTLFVVKTKKTDVKMLQEVLKDCKIKEVICMNALY